MGRTIKSVSLPDDIAKDVEKRRLDHNFEFSAWVCNHYRKDFFGEKEGMNPEDILRSFDGDIKRLYRDGIRAFGWSLSFEEFLIIYNKQREKR